MQKANLRIEPPRICAVTDTKPSWTEETHMKATEAAYTAILALLFGTAVQAPCLPRPQIEAKDQAKADKSEGKQPQPLRPPRQSNLSSQPRVQVKPQLPVNNSRQQYQQVEQGQQERVAQRQHYPQQQRDQSGANRPQQPDMHNQSGQRPQGLDKNRARQPFNQQHERTDGHNRDSRDHERPDYHRDDRDDHHNDWQGRRARDWRSDHRTWEQRGGYRGPHIPEYQFSRYFGPRHFFRIHDLRVVYFGGYPRFLYGGYWFGLVDPWPEYWADDWYETDDLYIAYAGDGYYLFNRGYPGVGIAVSISR